MIIKKRLMVERSKEVNAALIYDEGEEYPVLLASLLNTVYFPQLIQSGYKLTSLPYGFIKDGIQFTDLPCEVYNASQEELERMYYSVGTPTPNEELKKYIDTSAVVGLKLPPTRYTVNTREEFISYLEAINIAASDMDFMPINYFVAPDARFTREEFFSEVNQKYVAILENRRNFSLKRFHNLLKFLKSMELIGANPSAMDVLDAYFAWGIDGLQFTMLSRTRKTTTYRMLSNPKQQDLPMMKFTMGLMDGMGNLLTADIDRGDNWKLPSSNPDYTADLIRNLQPNQTTLVELHAACLQDTTTLEGSLYNIQYSEDNLVICGTSPTDPVHSMYTLKVQSPSDISRQIPLSLALPANADRLLTQCMLESLANFAQSKRKPGWDVSSFKALTVNGLSYKNALNYIISKLGMRRNMENKIQTEDAMPEVTYAMVESYLAKDTAGLSEEASDFIYKILEGIVNVDKTASGKDMDAQQNNTNMYKQLFAIHHVLGISLEDIYEQLKNIGNVKEIEFSNNGLTYKLNVAPINYSLHGWQTDVNNYSMERARECTHFTFVTRVAGEVAEGVPERHVGMEFMMVNMAKYEDVRKVISGLEDAYADKVNTCIPQESERHMALQRSRLFAYRAFFEIALRGTITLSQKWFNGQQLPVNPEWVEVCRKRIETKIESLEAYCDLAANAYNTKDLRFMSFCVNAYVTPDCVIPADPGNPIPMIPFYAAWTNWRDENTAVFAALVEKGVLPANYTAWSMRYYSQQYKYRSLDELDGDDSLLTYYERAVEQVAEWPTDRVFKSVTHPCDYLYPGLSKEDDMFEVEMEKLPVPRTGAPVIRVGASQLLRYEDFKHKLSPVNMLPAPDTFVRRFTGFPIEALLYIEDVFNKLPSTGEPLTVMASSDSVFVPDTMQLMHYSRIVELDSNKYAVRHIYDRTYVVRGTDGSYWEVRV